MLSLSLSLPSLRGCLKLPSLTLFTFSLFYRYQEEMAWNPAVFRTLDKLHSHSKWIYMNKEADTWRQRVRWDNNRWGKKVQKEGGPLKCIERTRWMQRQGGVGKTDVHCKWDEIVVVFRLHKVGSEGLAEVLWSTACDQYTSGLPHYCNRSHCIYHTMDWWHKIQMLKCVS